VREIPISPSELIQIKLEVTLIGPEGTQTTTIKTHAIVRQIEFVKYHKENETISYYAIPSLTLENHGNVDVRSVETRRRKNQ
jgi:hypothetical protein